MKLLISEIKVLIMRTEWVHAFCEVIIDGNVQHTYIYEKDTHFVCPTD